MSGFIECGRLLGCHVNVDLCAAAVRPAPLLKAASPLPSRSAPSTGPECGGLVDCGMAGSGAAPTKCSGWDGELGTSHEKE
jgi:hypothetical protein